MRLFRKTCIFGLTMLIVVAPFVASATEVVTTKEYVDGTTVAKYQGETSGNNTITHEGDILQVNSGGNLARTTPLGSITSTHTAATNFGVPTESAVVNYAVQKPASVANGKVLTFTSATATDQPEAQYIKVPIAASDPSASSNPATPSGFASIWLQ